ncbi:Uncharacterised protein [Raoultella planticola]|uniref:hypothetical protein n=1 Tax=Raoultella planticola TaxID=575 RepID=UPI0010F10C93|nr:hypothetical protein [Raoultella planticola]VTM99374.1 Uncharacterised protein [Raoultella planticola]
MKTKKSQKTKYRSEITALEFLKTNPDLTARQIANALGRGMASVNGQLRQLHGGAQIVQSGLRDGVITWRFNDMPFGCANRLRMMFESLLRECRGVAQ